MSDSPLDTEEMLESADDFGAAYEFHAQAIYRFLLWRTNDAELAEDLTSHVFEKAWRSRSSFQGGSVKAWLHKIARNVLIDHWRKRHDLPVEDVEALMDAVPQEMDEALDVELELKRLRTALAKLPKPMRVIIRLRFIEGQSSKQVAGRLGISEANVRVIQYRALKKLRNYLS